MADDARTIEGRLWDFVYAYDAAYDAAARAEGLTASQACLLDAVVTGSRTMGELATALLCDASNVTQLVARLEARGLVRREADPADRRAKRVSITPAGRTRRGAVDRGFTFPADRVGRLTTDDRRRLADLLTKLGD